MEKLATTMNVAIDEVFKSNFSIFESYDEAVKKEQISKISYIETIAHQLEKNLAGVNLFEIFPNNNNIIIADEKQINDILINFDRTAYFGKPDEVKGPFKFTDDQLKTVDELFNQQLQQRQDDLRSNIRHEVSNAEDFLRRHNSRMDNANRMRRELEALTKGDATGMIENLESLLSDPRFEFHQFYSGRIEVKIVDDIICTLKNDRAGINLRVNFGKLKFVTRLSDLCISVKPFEHNVYCDDHYHPHLASHGGICLGNMSELYNEAAENKDVFAMYNIVMDVLLNYNDNDPYVSLARFAEVSEQMQPNGQRMEVDRSPRYQYHTCPECENEMEIEFPSEHDSDYSGEWECGECGYMTEYEWYY